MGVFGLAGKCETALANGDKTALHGNLKLGIFAGLQLGRFVRGRCRKIGIRKFNYAESAKCIDR